MSTPQLDTRRSLYDSYGYRHTLVHQTPLQLVTRLEGLYWLWDRSTGLCLVNGLAGERLSNDAPPGADLRAQGDSVAETRAYLMARRAWKCAAEKARLSVPAFGAATEHGEAPMRRQQDSERTTMPPRSLGSMALFTVATLACLWPARR